MTSPRYIVYTYTVTYVSEILNPFPPGPVTFDEMKIAK